MAVGRVWAIVEGFGALEAWVPAIKQMVPTLLPPSPLPLTNIRSTLQLHVIEPNLTEAERYSQADQVPSDIATAVGAVVGGFYRENLAELNALTENKRVVRTLI